MLITRLLGLAGLLGGLAQIAIRSLGDTWGPPGTLQYTVYELTNRYMAVALLLMGLGFVGLRLAQRAPTGRLGGAGFVLVCVGWAMMITGTALEFYIFTDQPYGELNARALSWTGMLLGILVMLVGAALWGWAAWRTGALPRWVAGALLALLPAQVVLMPLGLLGVTAALSVVLGGWLMFGRVTFHVPGAT
jgi:hypothetical protein